MKPVVGVDLVGENISQGSWVTVTSSSLSSASVASMSGGQVKVTHWRPINIAPKIITTKTTSNHFNVRDFFMGGFISIPLQCQAHHRFFRLA